MLHPLNTWKGNQPMLITIETKDADGTSTTVVIDPAKDGGRPSPVAPTPNGGAKGQGPQPSNDAEKSFADRFGWPPQDAIVLEKESPTFDADKALIKASKLYRWDADFQRQDGKKGAWALKG